MSKKRANFFFTFLEILHGNVKIFNTHPKYTYLKKKKKRGKEVVRTGKGSAPSWITNPSITCVRIWGFTMACGGLFSPFWGAVPVMLEAEFPFPEVMPGLLRSVSA